MKRSRFAHFGFFGLWFMWFAQSSYAIGAEPSGSPGWPELAFWMASAASTRMALTHFVSMLLNEIAPYPTI